MAQPSNQTQNRCGDKTLRPIKTMLSIAACILGTAPVASLAQSALIVTPASCVYRIVSDI